MSKLLLVLTIVISAVGSHTAHISLSLVQGASVPESISFEQEEQATIRHVLKQFIDVWNQDDADRLVSLFTEDGSFQSCGPIQRTARFSH